MRKLVCICVDRFLHLSLTKGECRCRITAGFPLKLYTGGSSFLDEETCAQGLGLNYEDEEPLADFRAFHPFHMDLSVPTKGPRPPRPSPS